MSSRDQKKREKEKEKERRVREAEKFDNNVDMDNIPGTSGGSQSSVSPTHSATAGRSTDTLPSDTFMTQFCTTLQSGFDSVSNKLSEKLDSVSKNITKGLDDVSKNLQDKIEDIVPSRSQASDLESDDERFWIDSEGGSIANSDGGRSDTARSTSSSMKGKGTYFKNLNKPPPEERLGEKVNEDLAEATDRFFRKPISQDEFKELKTKYVRPENVSWIRAPEIPENVYSRLPSDFKNTDKTLHYIQEQLAPVISSLVYAIDKLGDGDLDGGRDILSDTMSAFEHVFKVNITNKRRALLKNKLPGDFKVLVTDKCESSPTKI